MSEVSEEEDGRAGEEEEEAADTELKTIKGPDNPTCYQLL